MIFSSVFFLSVFFPITLFLYFVAPKKWRNGVLFAASLIFYAWGEPKYIVLMLFSTILDYSCGLGIERYCDQPKIKKRYLWLSMIGNLGLLGFFKYYDFFAISIGKAIGIELPVFDLALPIGISFYTFQTMSYTIDVYLGNCQTQRNIISFGCYVTMFPQLIAGPIVRYVDVVKEIDHRKETIDEIAKGIRLFIIGLGKKVLLANSIGSLWDHVYTTFQTNQEISVIAAWLGILAFSFQLYFDFSGYSDMATGMGHMFGFKFPKNFNYPYISTSISDFWRRWHMTLGTWFKEYVYIPLGGNRTNQLGWLRNVFVVWLLTGLWHGANWNYVVWGLYFGILLVLEKMVFHKVLSRLPNILKWLYTMTAIVVAWVLFSIESLPQGLNYLKAMFGLLQNPLIDRYASYQWSNYGLLLIVLCFACTPLWKIIVVKTKQAIKQASAKRKKERANRAIDQWMDVLYFTYCLIVLFASMAYLVDASYNPFLYFRF